MGQRAQPRSYLPGAGQHLPQVVRPRALATRQLRGLELHLRVAQRRALRASRTLALADAIATFDEEVADHSGP